MPPSAYFASKSYQSACATISPTSDAIGSRLPSTPTSTSIPGWNSSTSTLSSWRRASATAASSSSSLAHLRDPDRRAEAGRLHEHRVAERVLERVARPERDVPGHRDPAVAEHRLEEVLVHAERRRSHAGADVGNAGELEQALHGAVLAERAVEDGQHDVDRAERRRRAAVGTGSVSRPTPVSASGTSRGRSAHAPSRPISIMWVS